MGDQKLPDSNPGVYLNSDTWKNLHTPSTRSALIWHNRGILARHVPLETSCLQLRIRLSAKGAKSVFPWQRPTFKMPASAGIA